MFARKGFHNSRIAEIAGEAGVASGTIYLYFRSKDEILIHVFEESLDRIIQDIAQDLEILADPREKLQTFIEHHLRLLKEHRELAEVLQVELRQSHKFMKEYEPRHWVRYLNIIAGILKEGQDQGLFRTDFSPGIWKRAVFGALDEIALYWVVTRKDESFLQKAARQLSRMLLEGAEIRDDRGRKETKSKKTAHSV